MAIVLICCAGKVLLGAMQQQPGCNIAHSGGGLTFFLPTSGGVKAFLLVVKGGSTFFKAFQQKVLPEVGHPYRFLLGNLLLGYQGTRAILDLEDN